MMQFVRDLVSRSSLAHFLVALCVFSGVFLAVAQLPGLDDLAPVGPIVGIIVFMSTRRAMAGRAE